MFRIFLTGLFFTLFSLQGPAQLRLQENNAFQRGELLEFKVYYHSLLTGNVAAGIASLEVTNETKYISGRITFHIIGKGKTLGAFNLFYKVNDCFETYIDEKSLAPWLSLRRINEDGYIRNEDIVFNQTEQKAWYKNNITGENKQMSTPQYTQDILAAYYYARTLEIEEFTKSNSISIPFAFSDSVYSTTVLYTGTETINTSIGTVRCKTFKPQVIKGNVFSDSFPMTLWISDDQNRLPILATSTILLGEVKLELVAYSGLKNPFKALIK